MFEYNQSYWVQYMLEYTGAIYTSGEVVQNVTVCGSFLGCYQTHAFNQKYHSDLYCLFDEAMYWYIPVKYKECVVPTDTFLKDVPPRLGGSFSTEERKMWSKNKEMIYPQKVRHERDGIYRAEVAESDRFSLVTHVGVARPAYATCPVRTLIVFTKLHESKADLRQWYNLTSMEETLKLTDLPPVSHSEKLSGYSYIEFADTEGPLLWVQFTTYQTTQVEIPLKTRRVLRHAEILLLDIDDRREEYGTTEIGIDITYVIFAGTILPKKFEELLR